MSDVHHHHHVHYHGCESVSVGNFEELISLVKGLKEFMANLSEAQVARLETDLNKLGADIGQLIADATAKIAQGGDPQPLLDRIDAAATGLENLDLTVKAGDPGPVVPPVPPATPGT